MVKRILVPWCLLFLLCCRNGTSGQYPYQVPQQLEDGITIGTLQDVGIDSTRIFKALRKIQKGNFNEIHSVLIHKNGRLILEEYFPGHRYQWDAPSHHDTVVHWNRNELHSVMSVTKSVTSALVGLAVEKGFIKSVDQSIFDFLPEHQHLRTMGKEGITIEHLLTMTSGLDWAEWNAPYSSRNNPMIAIWYAKKDPVSYILEGELVHEPGSSFSYYGGSQILLGEIIRNASQMTIAEFSQKYLFGPLGIADFDWSLQFGNGVYESAGALRLKPRDMLKIGIVYLNGGKWKDNRILSKEWVGKSKIPFGHNMSIQVPGEDMDETGYSYSWWLDEFQVSGIPIATFHASGWGGQKIIVIPKLETVVVFTGGNYTSKPKPFKILERYILPAMVK